MASNSQNLSGNLAASPAADLYSVPTAQKPAFTLPDIDVGQAIIWLRQGPAGERAKAARLIGDAAFIKKIRIPEAIESLCAVLTDDPHAFVREEAVWALWKLGDMRAQEALLHALSKDDAVGVREKAARALGLLGVRRAVPLMIALLSMGKQVATKLRAGLVAALGLLADERAAKVILQSALDAEPAVRFEAVKSLGRCLVAFPPEVKDKAMGQIKKALDPRRESVPAIRQAAVKALRVCNDSRAAAAVARAAVKDPDPETRRQAVEALLCFDGEKVEEALLTALEDSHWDVRKTAGRILVELVRRSQIYNLPRVCEALARMERMFPSGSREWRLAAMAFANL